MDWLNDDEGTFEAALAGNACHICGSVVHNALGPEGCPREMNEQASQGWMKKVNQIIFHSEFGTGEGHAAVNVKVYNIPAIHLMEPLFKRFPNYDYERESAWLFEDIAEDFWNLTVQEIARDAGFVGAYSEGRSSGWAVPYYSDGRDRFITPINILNKDINNYLKFKTGVEKVLSHLNENIRTLLVEDWYRIENEFLRDHSVTIRSIEAWK